jgi:hypothetical protein
VFKKIGFALIAVLTFVGCEQPGTDAPDILGSWNTSCVYKNPDGIALYIWKFEPKPVVDEPSAPFTSTELKSDGTVSVTESFYVYDNSILIIKNATDNSGDKFYFVSKNKDNSLELKGGEYTCTLTKHTEAAPQ